MAQHEALSARRWEKERETRLIRELRAPHKHITTLAIVKVLINRVNNMANQADRELIALCDRTPRRDPYYEALPEHDSYTRLLVQRYMALTNTVGMLRKIEVLFENEPRLTADRETIDKRLQRGERMADIAVKAERALLDQHEERAGRNYLNADIEALDNGLPTGIEGE